MILPFEALFFDLVLYFSLYLVLYLVSYVVLYWSFIWSSVWSSTWSFEALFFDLVLGFTLFLVLYLVLYLVSYLVLHFVSYVIPDFVDWFPTLGCGLFCRFFQKLCHSPGVDFPTHGMADVRTSEFDTRPVHGDRVPNRFPDRLKPTTAGIRWLD